MSLPSLPTRLFKLDKSGGKTIDTVDLDPSTKYYAVSHVWGSNIDWFEIPNVDVPWPIPATSKAKITFILDSCRQQQCDYIWCDILCVRQHPNIQDPEAVKDRIKEVKRMTEYYAGCTATIVFGDHYETFATRWDKVDAVIKIWEKDKDGQQPQTQEAVWKGFGDVDDFIGGRKGDQWFWRVWTLQETLLPPRLLTSEGIELRLDPFCRFVDWTYVALSKGILNNDQSELPHYEWIHPRQGIVNNNDWWKLSKRLRIGIGMFQSLGVTIDPLQALEITAFRQTSASYPKDALFAAYGLMDSKWYIEDRIDYTLDDVWRLTVAKLIEHNLSPLLAMAITTRGHMTWAAGRTRYMGEVIPTASKISKGIGQSALSHQFFDFSREINSQHGLLSAPAHRSGCQQD